MKYLIPLLCILLLISCEESKEEVNVDAMIAMEKAVHESNIQSVYYGSARIADLKGEFYANQQMTGLGHKTDKLKIVLDQVESIDKQTISFIGDLEKEKVKLLERANENPNSKELVLKKSEYVFPTSYDLTKLKSPIAESTIEDVESLASKFHKYTNDVMKTVGSYNLGRQSFQFTGLNAIKEDKSGKELHAIVSKKIQSQPAVNQYEDVEMLTELFIMGYNAQSKIRNNKGKTLIENLAILTAIQNDILNIRRSAISQCASRVSRDEYSFDQIIPLVYGPDFIDEGDVVIFDVMMAAFDSNKNPKIEVNSDVDYSIDTESGRGMVKLENLKKGSHMITGTVSIQNKSGVWRTREWQKSIIVQ